MNRNGDEKKGDINPEDAAVQELALPQVIKYPGTIKCAKFWCKNDSGKQ
jgi:hypothetical protein